MPARFVFHSDAQLFNVKQEEKQETLDEYWKRLVDISRDSEFSRITREEIITYNFAATINDKKAQDKFIKGPFELRTVLETIELDNYNREYGVKKETRTKKPEESPSVALLTEDKLHLPGQLGSEDRSTTTRISRRSRIAIFAENQTFEPNYVLYE